MKIKELKIRDFRGIDKLDLKFVSHNDKAIRTPILAGPNGCGKTSVLEACLLLLRKDSLLPKKDKRGYVRKGKTDFHLSGIIEYGGENVSIERTSEMKSATARPELPLNDIYVEYFSSWRYPKLVGGVTVTAGKRGKRPSETEENRLWLLKQYLVNLTASKAFGDSPDTASKEKAAYDRLNNIWKQFYPGRNERFVAKKAGEDVSEGFELFLEGRLKHRIPVDDLSSGEIEVFSLMGQSIRKSYDNCLVLIDEPELHLHPSWHRAIIRVFKDIFDEAQIICATRSQEILDSVYSYERFTLLPENDLRTKRVFSHETQEEQ